MDRHKIDKSESRTKSKKCGIKLGGSAGTEATKTHCVGKEEARLKYPRRRRLNGQVRLIRAAETVKQAGGRKWSRRGMPALKKRRMV